VQIGVDPFRRFHGRKKKSVARSQNVNRLSGRFCVRLLPVRPGRLQLRRA
jgi:hypothetical protein